MKKLLCVSLCVMLIVILGGCQSFEISGIESFNEMDCQFGLNYNLLPGDCDFLTNYPYENGVYHYWRNEWGDAQAKSYVQITYSEEVYQQAKLACTECFTFSEEQYLYDTFTFHVVNLDGGDMSFVAEYPGFRLLGYSDDTCTLLFLAYLDDSGETEPIDAFSFASFLDDHFGEWLEA